jgi:hypothetical protein
MPRITHSKSESKGQVAAQVDRKKARHEGQEAATGVKPTSRGGSGASQVTREMRRKEFDDLPAGVVEHVADVAGFCTGVLNQTNRSATMSINVGPEYVMDAVRMHLESARGFVMFRMYVVPRSAFLDQDDEEVA